MSIRSEPGAAAPGAASRAVGSCRAVMGLAAMGLAVMGLTVLGVAAPAQQSVDPGAGKVVRCEDTLPLTEPPCSYIVTQHAKGLVRADDPVVAWIRGKHNGGAAPLRHFLAGPRVVNDTYGLFFYDPGAGFVAAYEKAYGYAFHGWRDGVMVVRHEDGTLFSALTGVGLVGPRAGTRLRRVPYMTTEWGYWMLLHPESTAYDLFDGTRYPVVELPTEPAPGSVASRGEPDARLPAESLVLGVEVGEDRLAFPLGGLGERAVLEDTVGGRRVVVFWYGPTRTAVAFRAAHEGQELHFAVDEIAPIVAPFRDRESKTRWSPAGRGIDGARRGVELEWVDSIQCRWFAWAAENPTTRVHGLAEAGARDGDEGGDRDGSPGPGKAPRETAGHRSIVRTQLVDPARIDDAFLASVRSSGQDSVVLALHDRVPTDADRDAARRVRAAGLGLGLWLEVGRCEALADAHPEWVATIDGHDEWRLDRVGTAPRDHDGESRSAGAEGSVVIAHPWVPVRYREAFAAHLARVRGQLAAMPAPDRLYLNDLQGPPSACGCGNVLCRWATDYTLGGRAPSRAAALLGPDAAVRFVEAVGGLASDAEVVPVWVPECEEADTVADGACHGVGCYRGACWKRFDEQWAALRSRAGPVALLLPYRAFGRDLPRYGAEAGWIRFAVEHLKGRAVEAKGRRGAGLSVVLEAWSDGADVEAQIARAAEAGVGRVLVARTPIAQGWQPRLRRRTARAPTRDAGPGTTGRGAPPRPASSSRAARTGS